jgi:hypothetical protein
VDEVGHLCVDVVDFAEDTEVAGGAIRLTRDRPLQSTNSRGNIVGICRGIGPHFEEKLPY